MVVLVVDLDGILSVPREGDTPIRTHGYGIAPLHIARQWMEMKARKVEILRSVRGVEQLQDLPNSGDLICGKPACILPVPEALEWATAEGRDHVLGRRWPTSAIEGLRTSGKPMREVRMERPIVWCQTLRV